MNWKIDLAIVAVLALALYATYYLGHTKGRDAGDLVCVTTHANDAQTYAQKEADAQQLGRQAQAQADQNAINDLKRMLGTAQEAAASAAAAAATAKAHTEQLNLTLTELTHANADVDKWAGHCLPGALLSRLHPGTDSKTYPAACRNPGDGHKVSMAASTAAAAASH